MKYAYYPGCSAKRDAPELDNAMKVVCAKLGIELFEMYDAPCCGSRPVRQGSPRLFMLLNALILGLAESQCLDILTVCSTCQLNICQVNKRLKEDDALLEEINNSLSTIDIKYERGIQVKHFLWVLIADMGLERMSNMVTRPLHGLKVAPYYGCHILRPKEALEFDNPDQPSSLEKLILALGAEPVNYNGRKKCCGMHSMMESEEIALKLSGQNIEEALHKGADCLVTPCPLCHMVLDGFQGKAEKILRSKFGIPVLHLAQLVGLAIGIAPRDLMLTRHMVLPRGFQQRIRLLH